MTCPTCDRHRSQITMHGDSLRDSTRKALREADYSGRPSAKRLADIARLKADIAEARRRQAIHTQTCDGEK